MNKKQERRLDALLARAEAGSLSEHEVESLREILKSSPDAMDRYLEHCVLDAWLRSDELRATPDEGKVVDLSGTEPVVVPDRQSLRRVPVGIIATAALVGLGLFVFYTGKHYSPTETADGNKAFDEVRVAKLTPSREIYPLSDKHPALSGNGKLRGGVPDEQISVPENVSYNRHVRSLLSENCFFCHGPDAAKRKADLRLDTGEGATTVIDPDDLANSELVKRLYSDDPDEMMPPPDSGRHLTAEQRAILRRWVEQGAEYEKHWAFVQIERPDIPEPKRIDWANNAIDQFVETKLEEEGFVPSREADRRTLIRRLSLDLTGLPPTPDEVQAFLDDPSADAYEELVDRLLASPHYGERMALPWLDASRYADSNGFQQDGDRHSYIWRDWVVSAMNNNMPFDRFTIEQLAGDLLKNPTQSQLIATSFNRNHMLNGEGGAIAEEQRNNVVFDRVDTVATIWLGLTLACAQCHDHKFDPLTQKDYYRFFAYFNNVPETGKVDTRQGRLQYAQPVLKIATPEQEEEEKQLNKKRTEHKKVLSDNKEAIEKAAGEWWETVSDAKAVPEKLKPVIGRKFATLDGYNTNYVREEYLRQSENPEWQAAQKGFDSVSKRLDKLRNEMKVVMIMKEQEEIRPTHVLSRGDYESPLDEVSPGTPESLPHASGEPSADRLGLAKWLVSDSNPLTARVIVNRYWQQFFGTGLVKTAEDFGVQGEIPSHPELLDWLASEFIRSGWDVKHIHRLIVTSSTYRQSSRFSGELREMDPENRLLARSSRFRLPSMLIRDQALFLSGLLQSDVGGTPVYPYQPEGLWFEFSYEKFKYTPDHGDKLYRRSLYTFWRRTVAPPNIFDSANRQVCSVRSRRTNTPLHALVTLNDPTFVEASRVWAENMVRSGDEDPVSTAFAKATSREPNAQELQTLSNTLTKARDHYGSFPEQAKEIVSVGEYPRDESLDPIEVASYTQVAQLILNLDEVLNRE